MSKRRFFREGRFCKECGSRVKVFAPNKHCDWNDRLKLLERQKCREEFNMCSKCFGNFTHTNEWKEYLIKMRGENERKKKDYVKAIGYA